MNKRHTPLGEILKPVQRTTSVEQSATYQLAGIRSFGKGAFASREVRGSEIRYATLRQLREGDIVYPKLMAWEGAFAVVDPSLDAYWVSPEFCTFVSDPDQVDLGYIKHYLAWDGFRAQIGRRSSGTNVRRRRLQPERFLAHVLPLPSMVEQRRIANHLDKFVGLSSKIGGVSEVSAATLISISSAGFGGVEVPVGSLISKVSRPYPVEPEKIYAMLGVRWYGRGLFVRERKAGRDLAAKSVNEVRPGDLVYNRLFAWKQSFALAGALDAGFTSNEFPAFKINTQRVEPRVLLALLLSTDFTEQVNGASTGSTPASRNRLKEPDFLRLTVGLPPHGRQREIADALDKVDRLRECHRRRAAVEAALLPAARNEIFNSMQ